MNPSFKHFLSAHLFIVVVIVIAFYPSLYNGWTSWDDNVYVTDNPVVQNLTLDGIAEIFTTAYNGSYAPLTMLSYMVEYQIGGFHPALYHSSNLLLHVINAILVFWFIYSLSGSVVASSVAGMLFGIHPMHVESVAWISGRKDLLALCFMLLSAISYLRHIDGHHPRWITISFLFFIAALLSKIIVLTFPLLLLLIDWQRKRNVGATELTEKIPFVLAAAGFSAVGFIAQQGVHAVKKVPQVAENIVVALHGIIFYLEKFFFPVNLSHLYPYPESLTPTLYLYAFLSIIVFGVVVKYRRHRKIVFGFLMFVVMLLPVLQFIRFSEIFAADRFTYFSYIGLYYIAGVFGEEMWNKVNRRVLFAGGMVVVIFFSQLTQERCGVWKDSATLWQDMLSKYPNPLEKR